MNKKKIIVGIFALIGLLITIKLGIIYYEANFNPYAFASFCSVNEFIDCDGVAQTNESQFFGVPLALWGFILYAIMIVLLCAESLKKFFLFRFMEVFKNPLSYISALGLISFLISMTLFGISLFEIKKLCILCFVTYVLNFIISLEATDFKNGGYKKTFLDSFVDFKDAISQKKYLIAFIICALLGVGVLTYTEITDVMAPQAKRYKAIGNFIKMKKNPYIVKGNLLGEKDAKVVIDTYSDYMCPICFTQNIIISKIGRDIKGVKVIHHNIPLDKDCNKYLNQPFHQGSCMLAQYSIAAKEQGKFWEMNTYLFDKKPTDEDVILKQAKKMGFDVAKLQESANSQQVREELAKEIDEAQAKGIMATPMTYINGKKHEGLITYKDLKKEIEDAGVAKK